MSPAVPRKERTLAVCAKADLNGQTVSIILEGLTFMLFLGKQWLASSNSSRRLGAYAFAEGADRVRYDFDLAIDEE